MTDPSGYAKTLALPAGFDAPRLPRPCLRRSLMGAGEVEIGDDLAAESVAPERDGGVEIGGHEVRVVERVHDLGSASRVRTTFVVFAR